MNTQAKGIRNSRSVLLDALIPLERNPRRGDVEGIRASLERFGQMRPLVVLDDGTIVAGNHTYEAMSQMGWTTCEAVVVNLTAAEAEAYAITDNRLQDKAGYDDETLVEVLNDLSQRGLLEATGFDQDDLEDLVSAIGQVPEMPTEEFKGGYAEPPEKTAERWEGRDEGLRREVVFLLLEEDFEHFNTLVEDLQKAWGSGSKSDTIYQAIQFAHRAAGELAS